MKRFIIGLFTLTVAFASLSFTGVTPTNEDAEVEIPDNLEITDQWVPLTTQDGIVFSYKFADCHLAKFNWQQHGYHGREAQ